MLKKLKCLIRHDWQGYQEVFVTRTTWEDKYDVVIAWLICKRCAKSKLIHILK